MSMMIRDGSSVENPLGEQHQSPAAFLSGILETFTVTFTLAKDMDKLYREFWEILYPEAARRRHRRAAVLLETYVPPLAALIAYILGQGIADHGKERAKVEHKVEHDSVARELAAALREKQ